MTGRNEKLFLTPLLFSEVIRTQGWYLPQLSKSQLTEKLYPQIEALLSQIVIYGSYPEAITTADKEKYLINLAGDYLLKDVLYGSMINQPDTIKRLLLLLSYQAGSEASTLELSRNLSVSRQTVEHYLDLLEKIFVIFRLPAFSGNPRKEIVKSKKIYFWDTGVRNGLQKNFASLPYRSDLGSLWENWVVAEFAKQNLTRGQLADLYFWRTAGGSEVDLIVKKDEKLQAYEIKWSPTRQRRLPAFTAKYGTVIRQINRKNVVEFLL